MKLVTWNVNSIRIREERLLAMLRSRQPDLVCLQETKVVDELFPRTAIEALGYRVVCHGQRTYNGVALIARVPLYDVQHGMPDDPDPSQARLISATCGGMRVINVYVPNGSAVGTEKFAYKLEWLARLKDWLSIQMSRAEPVVVLGDFNIAPDDRDVYDPVALRGQVLFHSDEHRALKELLDLGLVDAFRLHHEEAGVYSWWDFRGGMFWKDHGMRIDLVLLQKVLVDRCTAVEIDRDERKGKQPSDHAPVFAEFG